VSSSFHIKTIVISKFFIRV